MALTTDSSTNNFQLTAYGDTLVVAGSGNPPFGGGSAYFDGDGDYLQLISTDAFNFYNSNFTIEGWIYSTTNQTGGGIISTRIAGVYSPWELQIGFPNINKISLLINNDGGWYNNVFYGDTTIPQNEWVHLAWVCQSGNHTVYVNGVADPSLTNLNAPIIEAVAQPENIYIGSGGDGAFTGYIDDLRVTKGIARYTSNFTPPTQQLPDPSDPNGANVSLLLHMDNLSGSTTFIDSSTNNFTLSAFGNTTISLSTKKFGNGSAYFDGTGDYLQLAGNYSLDFGTGDFTVEAWVNPSSFAPTDHFIINSVDANGLFFGWQNNTDIGWGRCAVAWDYSTASGMSTGTWYHTALTRSGSNMRIFVNGQQVGTTQTNSLSYNLNVNGTSIANQTGYYFNGYIDELRVTKGVARYTTNFVPQTAPFVNPSPVPTGYLAFWKLDDLTDSSTNNNNLTNNNGVQFVAGKIGNCAEFDTSNYLNDTLLSEDFDPNGEFTISCWIYPYSFSNYQAFLGGPSNSFIIHTDSGGTLYCNEAGSGDASVSSLLQLNLWQHIVFIKSLDGNTKVWYNGTNVYNQPTNNPGNYQPTTNITLGNYGGLNFPYNGKLDMVGLWNRELTEQEIAILYNNGNGAEP